MTQGTGPQEGRGTGEGSSVGGGHPLPPGGRPAVLGERPLGPGDAARTAHASQRRARRWAMKALYMLPAQAGNGGDLAAANVDAPVDPAQSRALALDLVARVARLEGATEGGDRDGEPETSASGRGGAKAARGGGKGRGPDADPIMAGKAVRPPLPPVDPVAQALAQDLVAGTIEHLADVDDVVAAVAQGWPLSHLAAVDRAILRVSAHELLHTDTPAPIVINDAVELARRYSTEDSPRFVNGVLGALAPAFGAIGPDRGGRDRRPRSRGTRFRSGAREVGTPVREDPAPRPEGGGQGPSHAGAGPA